jgi:hypothetical protein
MSSTLVVISAFGEDTSALGFAAKNLVPKVTNALHIMQAPTKHALSVKREFIFGRNPYFVLKS